MIEKNKNILDIINTVHGRLSQKLFIEFMETRFPNETDKSYIIEWISRFNSGEPEKFMDNISKKIYVDILKEYVSQIEGIK